MMQLLGHINQKQPCQLTIGRAVGRELEFKHTLTVKEIGGHLKKDLVNHKHLC